ncbi:hypothetical protein EH165_06440 [Nakamurella antarctica]|uniref:ABC-2 type transport system permease protein n=1 Tax=Nakamurella antarctica TaxID=1902245 RepID=A0A3G8ZW09_9ACTN|nr:hypothetical protein [Nakamurella antarctica]AZI57841.1 hypothetical protein EH165_06440 [Nakamurella antarctica]
MVAVFFSLKFTLVASRYRVMPTAKRVWAFVGLAVLFLVVGFFAFGISTTRTEPDVAVTAATIALFTLFIAWTLTPMIAFGVDETVDPHRFSLLPLRRRTLIPGLTAAAVIGILPMVNIIVLIGFAVSLAKKWWILPLALVCMGLGLLLCIMLSRAAATSIATLMSSRRGRDLGMLAGFGVFVLYLGVVGSLSAMSDTTDLGAKFTRAADALAWSPAGALARLPGLVEEGAFGQVGLCVVVLVASFSLVGWWWASALRRSMESVPSSTESSAPAGHSQFGGPQASTRSVVWMRDLMLTWRDPMRRLPWMIVIVVLFAMPFIYVRGHGTLFAVALGGWMTGTQAANQLGVDGSGLWLHIVATGSRAKAKAELMGHALTSLIPGLILGGLAVLMWALIRGDTAWLPAGLGLTWTAVVSALGLASWLSVKLPVAIPQSRTAMFASAVPAHKSRALGTTMAVLLGPVLLTIPVGVLVFLSLSVDPLWGWVALVVGPLYSGAMCLALINRAATLYAETGAEILQLVSLGDRV